MSHADQHGVWESKTYSIFGAARSIISNLSIGQDVTRISLPALFLRPYSLLEVFGGRALEYFDIIYRYLRNYWHNHVRLIFLNRIPSLEKPEDRLLNVVFWHLSFCRQESKQVRTTRYFATR